MSIFLLSNYSNAIHQEGGWAPDNYGGNDASITDWRAVGIARGF